MYLTGDTHIPLDIKKLNNLPKLASDDYLVVLGDFGLYWHDDDTYRYYRDYFQNQKYTTLWLDGNHENFEWINSMEVSQWNGGKVHKDNNIIHLMRGQVYTIEGNTIFTLGGAESVDRLQRVENISWWPDEAPNYKEYKEAAENLARVGNKVDYVFTHTCPYYLISSMLGYKPSSINSVEKALEALLENVTYKEWYFGHWHKDVDAGKYHCLYNRIIRL